MNRYEKIEPSLIIREKDLEVEQVGTLTLLA
jgi:hypothetical protein